MILFFYLLEGGLDTLEIIFIQADIIKEVTYLVDKFSRRTLPTLFATDFVAFNCNVIFYHSLRIITLFEVHCYVD